MGYLPDIDRIKCLATILKNRKIVKTNSMQSCKYNTLAFRWANWTASEPKRTNVLEHYNLIALSHCVNCGLYWYIICGLYYVYTYILYIQNMYVWINVNLTPTLMLERTRPKNTSEPCHNRRLKPILTPVMTFWWRSAFRDQFVDDSGFYESRRM